MTYNNYGKLGMHVQGRNETELINIFEVLCNSVAAVARTSVASKHEVANEQHQKVTIKS